MESLSGIGGENCLSLAKGDEVFSPAMNAGTGGVPICEISMRGLVGMRERDPDVALEAELPGRGGRMRVANGASSESSEDECELLLSESLSLALDLLRVRSGKCNVSFVFDI